MLPLLLLTAVVDAKPVPPTRSDLVFVQVGTRPVILSAPHGGRTPIPDCPPRKGAAPVRQFVTVNDTNTDLLAEALAAAVEKAMGGKPHVVIARFERKFCDANRPAADGYEHELARPHYDTYHAALTAARAAVTREYGRGLLLDLHGQAADPNALFRGTNDGKTVAHLLDRFGRPALVGPDSVFGRLAASGYTVIPANDSTDKEHSRFNGGYIVGTYGSRDGGGVDALQLETGATFRAKKNLDKSASDLAAAIAAFATAYLPAERK